MSNPNGGPAPTTIQDASPFPRQSAWQIGTITLRGQVVPVKVHYLLPLYWVFSLIMGIFRGGIYFGYLIVTDVLILFLTVFVHEIGHRCVLVCARATRPYRVHRVCLCPRPYTPR